MHTCIIVVNNQSPGMKWLEIWKPMAVAYRPRKYTNGGTVAFLPLWDL